MRVILLRLVGFAFGILGGLMFLSTLLNIGMIAAELREWLLMLFVLSLLPLATAYLILKKAKSITKDKNYRQYEALIIGLAQKQKGKLTIADVAVHTSLTFKEAEEYLKEMYLSGLFDMDTDEQGNIIYLLRTYS